MNNKTMMVILICFFTLPLLAGCNGSSNEDAGTDISTEEITGLDMDVFETPVDTPVDVPPEDLAINDAAEDPSDEEVVHDAPPEVEDADEVQDVTIEIPTDCILLEGEMQEPYSWTIAWMGEGTHVAFTLALSNTNSEGEECVFSDFTFREARLKLASDNSLIVEYESVEASDTPVTILNPGDIYSGDYVAHYSISTVSYCEQNVYATLIIDYMIGGSVAASLSLTTDEVGHACIY